MAVPSHTPTETRTFSLHLGAGCRAECRLCATVSSAPTAEAGPSLDAALAALRAARAAGHDAVLFCGGEPALHPAFLELVDAARALGFTRRELRTDGRLFAHPGRAERVAEAGLTHATVGLHGHHAAAHEWLAGPGSFAATLRGARALAAAGLSLGVVVLVTRPTFRALPDVAALAAALRPSAGVAFVPARCEGAAAPHANLVVPRLGLAAPYLAAALSRAAAARVPAALHGVPLCAAEGVEAFVADRAPAAPGRAKAPVCDDCTLEPSCAGPFASYLERHGAADLVPRRAPAPAFLSVPAAVLAPASPLADGLGCRGVA